MREIENSFSHIQKFLEKNPIPKASGSSQILFRGISGDFKIDKYIFEDDKKLLESFSQYRLQFFKELLVDIDWEDHIQAYVKQDEIYYDKDKIYSKGDIVDYYKDEYKYWIQANVLEDYGPIMQVSYKTPSIIKNLVTAEDKSFVKINKDSTRGYGVYTHEMYHQSNSLYEFLYSIILEKERSYRRRY